MRTRPATMLLAMLLAASANPSTAASMHADADRGWNGDWVISRTRNPKAILDQAAEGYRFHVDPAGKIVWEIPSRHEIVSGRLDGSRMPIHRPGTDGLALAVTAAGPQTLLYTVFRHGTAVGEGRMILAEQNQSWVDVSGPFGRPDLAGIVIYVRPGAGNR